MNGGENTDEEPSASTHQPDEPSDELSGPGAPATTGFNTIPANYDGFYIYGFLINTQILISTGNLIASTLPSPPVDPETKNPGGFQPYSGPTDPTSAAVYQPPQPLASSTSLTPEQLIKAQKYCKWAGSALTYEDIKSAIENLQKGLHLLQFGKEM